MERTFWRIRNVPDNFTQDVFEEEFPRTLSKMHGRTISMKCHSFAADYVSPTKQRNTAIVSFQGPLTAFLDESKRQAVRSEAGTYFCDRVFDGFTPLKQDQLNNDTIADCIVIPGWGGHPIGSFMAKDSPYVWVLDGLCTDFPQMQTYVYGYSPPLIQQTAGQDIQEFADTFVRLLRALRRQKSVNEAKKRPLIVMAHSMGGLIFKEAVVLLNSSSDMDDLDIHRALVGALFFGVPSSGMEAEDVAAMIGNSDARATLLELDQRFGHRMRQRLHQDFCKAFHYADSKIARFYEVDPSPTVKKDSNAAQGWSKSGTPKVLVTFDSATVARPLVDDDPKLICSLSGDHSTMIKLPEYPNTNYFKICELTTRLLHHAEELVNLRYLLTPPDRSDEVQYSSVGRNGQLLGSANLSRVIQDRNSFLDQILQAQSSSRRSRIDRRLDSTCDWLYRKAEFLLWKNVASRQHDRGLLRITGKPGSGKSVLMKALYTTNTAEYPNAVHLDFFFDSRGNETERTSPGLIRSLLRQLLEQATHLLDAAVLRHRHKNGQNTSFMSQSEVSELLRTSLTSLTNRVVYMYIDAIDECQDIGNEHGAIQNIVDLCEEFVRLNNVQNVDLRLAISSRRWPHVSISGDIKCIEIDMDEGAGPDIKRLVSTRLGFQANLMTEAEQDLLQDVTTQSRGVFMWAVLVARELKFARNQGAPIRRLKQLLSELPPKLNELYARIIERVTKEDKVNFDKIVRWVLFAHEPLDIESLLMALEFDIDKPPETIPDWNHSERCLNHEGFQTRVHDIARGLVEFRQFRGASHVYFIHDTVRRFFLLPMAGASDIGETGVRNLDDNMRLAHWKIAEACLNFFNIKELRDRPVAPAWEKTRADTPRDFFYHDVEVQNHMPVNAWTLHDLNHHLPFWKYAASQVFPHAAAAQQRLYQGIFATHLLKAGRRKSIFTIWERVYKLYASIEHGRAEAEYHLCYGIERVIGKDAVSKTQSKRRRGEVLRLDTITDFHLHPVSCFALWGMDAALELLLGEGDALLRKQAWLIALCACQLRVFQFVDQSNHPKMDIWQTWRSTEGQISTVLAASGNDCTKWPTDTMFIAELGENLKSLAGRLTLPIWAIFETMYLQWSRLNSRGDLARDQPGIQKRMLLAALTTYIA